MSRAMKGLRRMGFLLRTGNNRRGVLRKGGWSLAGVASAGKPHRLGRQTSPPCLALVNGARGAPACAARAAWAFQKRVRPPSLAKRATARRVRGAMETLALWVARYNGMRYKARMNVQRARDFVKGVLSQGRYSFTLDEASEATGLRGQALNMALQRMKRDGWVLPFSQGFYLALDVQHQAAGMLDPEWFVDDWARALGVDYYVGGLSAAAVHGAAHQRPVAFQVFMPRNMRPISRGGVRVEVFCKKDMPKGSVEKRKSPAGYFRVSNPELTAYDLLAYPRCCPSLDLAATVYVELGESVEPSRLAQLAGEHAATAALQRVGWLLDRTGWQEKTEELHAALQSLRKPWRRMDSRLPREGRKNARWKVIENAEVDLEVEA